MINVATMFTGGGIALSSSKDLINPVFACEYNADIASVYQANYPNAPIMVDRVQAIEPMDLSTCAAYGLDLLQASPQCTNASKANTNGKETSEDIGQAEAISNVIFWTKPKYFMLENVWEYREFVSFKLITDMLHTMDYHYQFKHINMADYGVPQTRKRLILLASRGDQERWQFPEPTHAREPEPTLWGTKERWVSWYGAIEDLIPALPESKFAQWQLDRLPEDLLETILTNGRNANQEWGNFYRDENQPAITLSATDSRLKAFIVENANASRDKIHRLESEPSYTVNSSMGEHNAWPKAYLVDCTHRTDGDLTARATEQPAFTVVSSAMRRESNIAKAFLVGDQTSHEGTQISYRESVQPALTVDTRLSSKVKAFICDGQSNSNQSRLTVRTDSEPMYTLSASGDKRPARAWLEYGRVVQMTVRALARFMSVLDSYWLPDNKALACRVLGNGIPPLFIRKCLLANPLIIKQQQQEQEQDAISAT